MAEHVSSALYPLFEDDPSEEELPSGMYLPKKDGRCVLYIVTRDLPEGYMRELMKYQGTEARILVPLKNKRRDSLGGLLGVDFIDSKYQNPDNMPSENVFETACESAKEVEFLLLSQAK